MVGTTCTSTTTTMIDISLTKEDAIALLLLINREQSIYTTDLTCTPASVVRLRAILNDLDSQTGCPGGIGKQNETRGLTDPPFFMPYYKGG